MTQSRLRALIQRVSWSSPVSKTAAADADFDRPLHFWTGLGPIDRGLIKTEWQKDGGHWPSCGGVRWCGQRRLHAAHRELGANIAQARQSALGARRWRCTRAGGRQARAASTSQGMPSAVVGRRGTPRGLIQT